METRGWNNLRDIQTLPNGTFDSLKTFELISYVLFSTRILSRISTRNIPLNILMLILMSALKNIRMK